MASIFDPLEDDTTYQANGSGFQFSAVDVDSDSLESSEYTLVGLVCDRSGSVLSFANEIEGCVKSALEGCQKSPRVDNMLVRTLKFNDEIEEVHGYRLLTDCHLAKYTGFIQPSGYTSLYDASINMVDSMATYGKQLRDNHYKANGIIAIITDGIDEGSTLKPHNVKEAIERARMAESLESVLIILIGINVKNSAVSQYLHNFKDEVGIDQYIEVQDASPSTFAKVAGFISKSVSSQSQALGSGSASQPINF